MKPVLVPGSFIRTYVGEVGRTWVLMFGMPTRRLRLDLEERVVVELCDGNRDAAEIGQAAAETLGRPLHRATVQLIIEHLLGEGALVPGTDTATVESTLSNIVGKELSAEEAAALRLVTPPGAKTGCDSRGGCCRFYDRIGLYPEDVNHIREAFAEGELTPGGLTLESAIRRDGFGASDVYALAVTDGACVLLDPDGLCSVHKRLGAMKKPVGCRQYPMRDVMCEGELHVGLAVECRCIIDFAEKGESIVPAAEEVLERRRETLYVEAVARNVGINRVDRWSRAEYLAWRARATAEVATTPDLAGWALEQAAALFGGKPGLALTARLLTLDEVLGEVERYFRQQTRDAIRVYSENDIERALYSWAEQTVGRLRVELSEGRGPGPALVGERFYVEQLLFTHNLLRARTLAVSMATLGLKLACARAGDAVALPPSLAPLTAVEVLFRAHGAGYLVSSEELELARALGAEAKT